MGFALKHLAEVQVLGNLHKGLSDTPLEMALVSRWPPAVEATPCVRDLSRYKIKIILFPDSGLMWF